MEKEKVIEVKNLKMYYKTDRESVKAVDDISFCVYKGETLGIVGESGCGKSSMAFSLMLMPNSPGKIEGGEIILNGKNIIELNENEIRKNIRWKEIAMVFQGAMTSLTPVFTIKKLMLETYFLHKEGSKKEAEEIIEKYINQVGLSKDILSRYPHQLSGGQKQRVIIAMALFLEPKLIICDEPTTALDVIVQAQIINLIKKLKKDLKISFIFITHDLGVVSEAADRVCVMYAGKIVEIGKNNQIYRKKNVLHPYTKKLLSATPLLYETKQELEFIEGTPPDLMSPPKGCRFYERCDRRIEKCLNEEPILKKVEDEHFIACFLA